MYVEYNDGENDSNTKKRDACEKIIYTYSLKVFI